MLSLNSIIVVAPGCPAELIQELLDSGILPSHEDFVVLLPPGSLQQHESLVETQSSSGRVQFFPSPARRFFSTRNLKWLKNYLRFSENTNVLITDSPYQDFAIALVSLIILLLSGKSINLLRVKREEVQTKPKPGLQTGGQNPCEVWLSVELNLRTLAMECVKVIPITWDYNRWEVLYCFMFVALVARSLFSQYIFDLSLKSCHRKS